MADYFRAVFHNGSFIPVTPCGLPDETQVLLTVHSSELVVPPQVTDPAERAGILRGIVERMRQNPLPATAAKFSRDQALERR